MRPISDYLKKLLYQYDCLVVPALGAFLTHGVSAAYNEATGQFLPPRRKVAFNEALRLDDGILLNYVMLHENCSREEALRAISEFVSTLKAQVRQQGSFVIDGLGMFTANAEENLQFDPELRHNFMGNAYGFQPLMLTRHMVHPAVPVVEKAAVMKPLPAPTMGIALVEPATAELGEVAVVPFAPRRSSSGGWRWAAAALLVGTLGAISYVSVIAPNQSLQGSLSPGNFLNVSAFLLDKSVKLEATRGDASKRSETAVTPVVAKSAPVVVKPAPVAPALVAKPSAAPVVAASAIAKALPAPVVVKKETVVAPVVQPKAPYTVIAGSFANRGNAIRFQKMLVKAGYEEAYILPGRTKGLIKVAAVGSDDIATAKASLDSLSELTGITPWVMRSR